VKLKPPRPPKPAAPAQTSPSNPDDVTPNDVGSWAGLQSIFGTVTRFGGAVVAIVAVSYLVGWRTASEYYGAFGAEWVTSLLAPSEFLQRSYGPLSHVVVGMLLGMVLTTGGFSKKVLLIVGLIVSLVPVVMLCLWTGLESYLGTVRASYFGTVAAVMLPVSCGMDVADHAFTFAKEGKGAVFKLVQFLQILWLSATFLFPLASGRPPGQRDADAQASRLPVAVAVGGENWRLLLARPDRCVLVKLENGKRPVTRVVPFDKIDRIEEYSEPKAASDPQAVNLEKPVPARNPDAAGRE
jgi:hypothetical protein